VHPTLGILPRFQAFFYALSFFQSDGVPPPDPARVTQTVRRFVSRMEKSSMKSPIVVGIASIIPGLGLWLVKKRRHAIVVAILMFSSFLFIAITSQDLLAGLCLNFFITPIWITQGFYAVHEANTIKAIKAGVFQPPIQKDSIETPPPNLSFQEKQLFKSREFIKQQLTTGEQVLDAMPVYQMSILQGAGSYRLYYIGLLKTSLLILHTDFTGRPSVSERIEFSSIENIIIKYGLLTDTLQIYFKSQQEVVKLKATRRLRNLSEKYVSTFLKQSHIQQ
jgi:hypothetical protein